MHVPPRIPNDSKTSTDEAELKALDDRVNITGIPLCATTDAVICHFISQVLIIAFVADQVRGTFKYPALVAAISLAIYVLFFATYSLNVIRAGDQIVLKSPFRSRRIAIAKALSFRSGNCLDGSFISVMQQNRYNEAVILTVQESGRLSKNSKSIVVCYSPRGANFADLDHIASQLNSLIGHDQERSQIAPDRLRRILG